MTMSFVFTNQSEIDFGIALVHKVLRNPLPPNSVLTRKVKMFLRDNRILLTDYSP